MVSTLFKQLVQLLLVGPLQERQESWHLKQEVFCWKVDSGHEITG